MHMNKRRQNNMGGGNGGQQNRHGGSNRSRRFGGGGNNRGGADDPANIVRTRRNATQSREKYLSMARDAMAMGDRVLAENYLQHADHFYRVLMALPPEEARQPYQRHGNPQAAGADQQVPGENPEHVVSDTGTETPVPEHIAHASSLPSFITHPSSTSQENLPQENL